MYLFIYFYVCFIVGNSRPVVRESLGANTNFMPINALNPYANRWTIKVFIPFSLRFLLLVTDRPLLYHYQNTILPQQARITSKSDMRRWSNAKGEGNLFSIDLLDGHGSEIRGTFFKEDADKFFPQLHEGQVFPPLRFKLQEKSRIPFISLHFSHTFIAGISDFRREAQGGQQAVHIHQK